MAQHFGSLRFKACHFIFMTQYGHNDTISMNSVEFNARFVTCFKSIDSDGVILPKEFVVVLRYRRIY